MRDFSEGGILLNEALQELFFGVDRSPRLLDFEIRTRDEGTHCHASWNAMAYGRLSPTVDARQMAMTG